MRYRKMTTTGWEISALGFGVMRLPMEKVDGKSIIKEDESIEMIRYGIDQGINYIDTAWPYLEQQSEPFLGRALKDGYRERVKLVTKSPMWEINSVEDFDRIFASQLEKLQTDHIDIYLLHSLCIPYWDKVKQLNLLDRLKKWKKEGRIKAIGFSFHDGNPIFKEIIDSFNWDMCQIQFNYVDEEYQAGLEGLNYATKKSIPVVVMEPLHGGSLVELNDKTKNIIESSPIKRKLADWGLRYVWNHPGIVTVLSGMGSMQMLKENIETAETALVSSMSADDMQVIDRLREIFKTYIKVPCTFCEYCMPCPQSVFIPKIFQAVNGISWYPDSDWHRSVYTNLSKTVSEVESVPNSGNASLCIECGICLDKCPQNINIPSEMQTIKKLFAENLTVKDVYPS